MNIADLGAFEIVLFGLVYMVVAVLLMHISGKDYTDEKVPWWRRWTRWK